MSGKVVPAGAPLAPHMSLFARFMTTVVFPGEDAGIVVRYPSRHKGNLPVTPLGNLKKLVLAYNFLEHGGHPAGKIVGLGAILVRKQKSSSRPDDISRARWSLSPKDRSTSPQT